MKKRLFSVIILIVFIINPSHKKLFAQSGEKVFEFLNFPSSVYSNAVGGMNVSSNKNDISLTFQNPALLSELMHNNLNVNYLFYVADIGAGNAIYGKAINELSNWAIGVNFMNYGQFTETTPENTSTGTFSGKDIALNGFYSRRLSDYWSGGVTAKFIYSAFAEYNSTALGVDMGLSYQNPDKLWHFGLAVSNVGAQISAYDQERVAMPWNITMGLSKELEHAPIRFSLTATHLNKWKLNKLDTENNAIEENENFGTTLMHHLIFGVDIQPTENFWIGLGYNPKRASDMRLLQGNRLSGFSAGAGLKVRRFGFGFAVSQYHPSATTLHFDVNVLLGRM